MALDLVRDNVDELPENIRKEYKTGDPKKGQDEDKFYLDTTSREGWSVDKVEPLKNTMSRTKEELKALKVRIKDLPDDFSKTKLDELLAELDDLKKGTTDEKVKTRIETEKKQLTDKFKGDLAQKDQIIADRDREIEGLLVDTEATRAILEHKGKVKPLLPHVKTQCKVVRDASTGKLSVVVVGDDGKTPRLTKRSGSDENMTIAEFVETLKGVEDFAPLFSGTGASGSGNRGSDRNGSGGSGNGQGKGSGIENKNQAPPSYLDRLREQRASSAGQ